MLGNLHFFFNILCGVQICLRSRQAGLGCLQIQSQLVDDFAKSFHLPPQEFDLFVVGFLPSLKVLLPLRVSDGMFANQRTKLVCMVHLLDSGVDVVYTDLLLKKKFYVSIKWNFLHLGLQRRKC